MPLTPKKYNLREKILTNLKQSQRPISVKDLQDKLNQEYNKTSVYRQLEILFKSRKINKIETGKETLFEMDSHKHSHFQCIKCRLIKCVLLPKDFNLSLNELEGFQILDISINIKGVCQSCVPVYYK
jgi:Fur family transcriptional regulator, ferric uptake regulator